MRSIGLYTFIGMYCLAVLLSLFLGWSVSLLLWLLGVLATAAVVARCLRFPMPVLSVLAGIIFACMRVALVSSGMAETFTSMMDRPLTIEGSVVSLPDLRETNEKVTVEIKKGNDHLRALVTVPLYPSVHVGDIVRLSGTLKRPQPFETDGGRTFAYGQFLRKDGIYATMTASAQVTGRSKSIWLKFLRALEWIKQQLSDALTKSLPEPESSLAVGILVGGKQGLGERLIEAFTTSGMLQIIVLSGFNVMIVASALMQALAKVPKRISFAVALGSIACFVLMSGASSSAVRAGLMAAFAITARTFGRQYDVLRIVLVSLFLIALYNPLTLAYDPGFQFSFIATIGLVVGTPTITPKLQFLRSTLLIELFSTTLAAETALLPFLVWDTGNLSLVSVFANVVAMPAIPFAMAASAAAAVLALPLSHVSSALTLLVGLPAYIPLLYVIHVATLSASLPFANRTLPAFSFWAVPVMYAALAALVYVFRPLRRGSDSPRLPSSGSRGTLPRTTSSPPAYSRP